MTSKVGMLWKAADEMKDFHDNHLRAMRCTLSRLSFVFCALSIVSHCILHSLGLDSIYFRHQSLLYCPCEHTHTHSSRFYLPSHCHAML